MYITKFLTDPPSLPPAYRKAVCTLTLPSPPHPPDRPKRYDTLRVGYCQHSWRHRKSDMAMAKCMETFTYSLDEARV